MPNHKKIFNHVAKLKIFVLLVDWTRPASGLFQGCLDNHNEILQLPGIFRFHNIWNNFLKNIIKKNSNNLEIILNKFISYHQVSPIFNSSLQKSERWHQLGSNQNKSFKVSKKRFKLHMKKLLKDKKINAKNFYLATHAAYFLARKQDPLKTKVLFYHLHRYYEVIDHEKDFPNSNYIVITRDIRNGLVSYLESRRKSFLYTPESLSACLQGAVRSLNINTPQNKFFSFITNYRLRKNIKKLKFLSYKLLHEKPELVLRAVCKDLKIKFKRKILFKTTVNGLVWWADTGSKKKFTGFSPQRANLIKWPNKLNKLDLLLLEVLFFQYINIFSYKKNFNNLYKIITKFLLPFLIFIPMKYEKKFFLHGLKKEKGIKKITFIKTSIFYYFKRIKTYLEAIVNNLLTANKKISAYGIRK